MKRRTRSAVLALAAFSLVATACGSDEKDATTTTAAPETTAAGTETTGGGDTTPPSTECAELTPVSLQLQWVTQAQFAGYYAAVDQGLYAAQCLDVTILEGGVDIVPQEVLASGAADFAISWVPKSLASRENGADIVDIAQVFQRSGTLQVSFKDAGITSPADFAGKTIGNWGFGNEYEIFAAINEAGLDPLTDVTLVQQNFDMVGLLDGEIDAAEAMTYNELAQVLEAVNPDTGELYTLDDLNIVNYEEAGVGMLQDAIWADGARLSDATYNDTAVRFVAASLAGWAYCRDNAQSCADIVLEQSPILGASHQLWQINEVNKLIWPAAEGVGFINEDAWNRTVELAQSTPNAEGATVLSADPGPDAYTNDIVSKALALLQAQGIDVIGTGFKALDVELVEGGA